MTSTNTERRVRIYRYKGVPYVTPGNSAPASFKSPCICGVCKRIWDDAVVTSITPTPAGRCPFEYMHKPPEQKSLPPDPEDRNEERAAWALHAVRAFQEATGSDDDAAIGDLLCDLRHLCDRMGKRFGTNFDAISARAHRCYIEETDDGSNSSGIQNSIMAVVLEGGLVQSVVSNTPQFFDGVDIIVIDYDDEGADEKDLTDVPQGDGSISDAIVSGHAVGLATIDLAATYRNLCDEDKETDDEK